MLRVIELFAGIGSQTQALKNISVEHEVIAISEIDKHSIRSYEAMHGPVNNLGDIKNIESLPEADLWTYSFPCQDISNAGLSRGFAKTSGTRSGLLWEVERLLNTSKLPQTLLMENVPMLLSERYKKDFSSWVRALAELGYTSYYGILNSKDFDVPQDRNRVFMVSTLNGDVFTFPKAIKPTRKLKDVLETDVPERYYISPERTEGLLQHLKNKDTSRNTIPCLTPDRPNKRQNGPRFKESDEMFTLTGQDRHGILEVKSRLEHIGDLDMKGNDCIKRVYNPNGICPTLDTMGGGNRQPKITEGETRVRKLTPLECWRLMGFNDRAFNLAKASGVSDSQLYRQAGNSIVVPVLEAIFTELYLKEKKNHRQTMLSEMN